MLLRKKVEFLPIAIVAIIEELIMTFQETLASIAKSGLPLQGKLDALKAEFEANVAPAAAVAALHRSTDELIASGAQNRALKAGQIAPEFTLPDADGKLVSSRALLAKGPLVVTFYRGAWCPYCNFDLSALEEVRSEIESRGASLVAISQQTAPNSRKSQRQNGLGYPILGDHGGEVAAQFGLRWTLPMPARYVIEQDGTIAYAEVNADYTRRPEPSAIFPVLEKLGQPVA